MPFRNGPRAWGPAHFPWLTTIAAAALVAGFALDGRSGRAVVAAESSAGSLLRPGVDPIVLARRVLLAPPAIPGERALATDAGRALPTLGAAHAATPVSAMGVPVEPPSKSSSEEPSGL